MGSTAEIILTCIAMGFWVLFPVGMFLAISRLDKDSDQIARFEQYHRVPVKDRYREQHFDWHHPILYFRRWLQHD